MNREEVNKRVKAQKEADWKALHYSPRAYAEYIRDGGLKPSWSSETDQEHRQRIRSLGYDDR